MCCWRTDRDVRRSGLGIWEESIHVTSQPGCKRAAWTWELGAFSDSMTHEVRRDQGLPSANRGWRFAVTSSRCVHQWPESRRNLLTHQFCRRPWDVCITPKTNPSTEIEFFVTILKKDFIYSFSERGEGWEKKRERHIYVWLPLTWPPLGTWPATQAYALTGNRTGDLLVCNPHSIHWATPAWALSPFWRDPQDWI